MDEAINETKKMIDNYLEGKKRFRKNTFYFYDKVYATTTENIEGYLSLVDFQGKSDALTILASGDQTFSLASKGIKNITTFDINNLTKYYALGLKRAAIDAFGYHEFLDYFKKLFDLNISLDELNDRVKYLLKYMDYEYKTYWENVIDYNYQRQKYLLEKTNLFKILLLSTAHGISRFKNSYLKTEEDYNYLRGVIGNINISFDALDFFEVPYIYEREYDFILLSNIADYMESYLGSSWTYEVFREEILKFHKLLKKDGVIFIAYLIGKHKKENKYFDCPLIYPSLMTIKDLKNEELILLPHIDNDRVSKYIDDAIILERKK